MTRTNATTKAILIYLNTSGFKAWRTYNGGVYDLKRKSFRKNPSTLLGIPDICGYNKKTGISIFVEIKTGKDRLSYEQDIFLVEAKKAGCIAIVAKNFDHFLEQFKT